jgi:hypothetical protein
VLYAAVIPLVHLTERFGLTEQVMTLFPDKNFATFFSPGEVDGYLMTLKNRAETHLKGGNITAYEFSKEPAGNGMFIIKVIQHVA